MSFTVETITYGNDKHCFISLSAGSKFQQNKEVNLFELDVDGRKVYVSWSGEYIRSEDGTLQISRHFAEKLEIKENHEVTMKPLSSAPQCMKAVVEPVSADDWEILDRHTNRMVTDLQNQVRVVQPGVIYPFWVNKSTSVFIKVVSIEPDTEYAILVNETEVHLAPKVRTAEQERGGSIGQEVHEQQMKQSVTDLQNAPFIKDSLLTDEDGYSSRFTSVDSAESDYMSGFHKKKTKQDKTSLPVSSISNQWHAIRGVFFSYLGFKANSKTVNSDSEEDDLDESDHFTLNNQTITSGLNMVLRVQHLLYTPFDHDTQYSETILRRGSSSPRKNGSVSPRKFPSKFGKSSSLPKSGFRHNFFPQQPSTIYMDLSDAEKQLECSRSEIPFEFFAKLRKLQSPKDQQQEKQQPPVASTAGKQGKGKNEKNGNGHDNGHSASCTETECNSEEGSLCVVVRVLVIDRRRSTCSEQYSAIVKRILEEQSLLEGHVIIPDMLRRTLKLDVTSRVWIQTFKGQPAQANGFVLHPLGNVNKRVTSDVLVLGFRQWLDQVSHEDYPMVIFQGFFVRFPVLPDEHVEVQITYNEVNKSGRGCYALLHPGVLRNTSLTVISGRSTDAAHPAIQPMLAYTSLSSIDPIVSKHRLEELGGLSELIEAALLDIETCLGSRPMYKEAFQTTPGLLNGMLLLTGPKGSGKTTLAKALCNRVAQLPNLAYTMIVDCKPLRGKKMDTIMRTFELVFDEAAWRQPTLIVLDDLDHIAGAPAGPEFELSSEALYAARVAEVVKDLLRKDIRNLTNIAVLASSVSRSSLHPILVSSRGTHLVQEVLAIKPPNLLERKEILQRLMESKSTFSDESLKYLDLNGLSLKLEGYVAKDLENIISRAVHAHILRQGRGVLIDDQVTLIQEDFEVALRGFTPASIRNVPLHQSGDLGWNDIGGLTDVKETLVETLQWPTKYPALFASCPLRLRSGLLLYGAPGTGKTLLAGVVAKECGLNFISIKGPEMLSKYIGASEQAVRDIFIRAQSAKPCILFFDEFDSIAPRRGHDNTGVTDRVVNQLLTQLDGVEGLEGVYVLAATSRPDLIDPALLRPGRLDKSLHCKMPNEEERLKILKALSHRMSLDDNVNFELFAKTCVDFTGADMKALLYNAQLEAIHEFTSQEGNKTAPGSFGAKVRKEHSKLRSKARAHLKVNVKLSPGQSVSGHQYAYIPNLEEGVVQVSMEMEEKLSTQVSQIFERERRTSVVNELPDSPILASKILRVRQEHLICAASKIRPSVSGSEKLKYQRIYESFISSKGANFDAALKDEIRQLKATLA